MTFSGKMCPMLILKVTKKQGLAFSLENTVFKKPQRRGGGQFDPHAPATFLGIRLKYTIKMAIIQC